MQGLEWEAYWHYMELCEYYDCIIIPFENKSGWNRHYSDLLTVEII